MCYDEENIAHGKEKAPTLIIEHDIRSQDSHYITTSLWGSMIVADRWNGKESFQALRRFLLLFLAESGFILGQDRGCVKLKSLIDYERICRHNREKKPHGAPFKSFLILLFSHCQMIDS